MRRRSLVAGHRLHSGFGRFAPVLKQWNKTLKAYSDRLQGADAAWWFNERPDLSFLAAAVWQSGGIAIEEYSASKGGRRYGRRGRVDLYALLGRGRRVHGHAFEAKKVWVGLSRTRDDLMPKIRAYWQKACKDARSLNAEAADQRWALLFVTPYFSRPAPAKEAAEALGRLVKTLTGKGYHVLAWHFDLRRVYRGTDGRHYPGIILAGARVK